jgi:1,4-dihydroxy-2-naphthoyl-CoA synthase
VPRVAGRFGLVRAVRRDHQSGAAEQAVGAVLYGTDDAREGIAAFVAKRRLRFDGH